MAEIKDLISEMKLNKKAEEKRNKGRKKDDQAQLTALGDLETTFPQEFENILKKQGMVGEKSPFAHTNLLDDIRVGVDGMKLSVMQRLKDSFTNLGGLFPSRAARKRARAVALATKLMQADTQDISKVLHTNQKFLINLLSSKEESKGAAGTEEQREQAQREEKTITLLETMAEGMTTGGKARADVEGGGDMLDKLKKALISGAFAALIAAAVWFLNSKYWVKTKEFFVDDFMPFAKMLWEDYLKPIGAIWVDHIMKSWENIKELFSGLKESFELFGKGEWWEGIKKFFGSIGTFLGKQIDNIITAAYNIIATIFGLEETDSVFGSIKKFFTDLYDNIAFQIKVTLFKIEFAIKEVWTSITTTITDIFTGIKDWFGKLFNFSSVEKTMASIINVLTFMPNMIKDLVATATSWLLGLFGFDDAAKTAANVTNWSIGSLIMDTIKAIGDFFWKGDGTGLLEFDLFGKMKIPDLSSVLPDFSNPFAGIMDSINKSDFFKDALDEWATFSPILSAKGVIKKALTGIFGDAAAGGTSAQDAPGGSFAAGGSFSKGQEMLVGELGPEMILPNQGGQVLNAQRTQQMMQAGIQRDMGGAAGGGGTTSINTGGNVVSSPTTNYVNNGTAARRPIFLTAPTALA